MDPIFATQPIETRRSKSDDRRLVARFRTGDALAFDELVAIHQESVTRLASRLLGWSCDVDDVVQDIFLCVLENLHNFRQEAAFSTWLTTIAVNKCRSHARRRALRLRKLTELWGRRAVRQASSPGECIEQAEREEEIRRAVRALPVNYRETVVLRYFEDLSAAEIGAVLGISANAVEVRLSRARRRLKQHLSAHDEHSRK